MDLFSQRKGIKPVKSIIQSDNIDEDMRNSLWNALTIFYWDVLFKSPPYDSDYYKALTILLKTIWVDYFKKLLDTLGDHWGYAHSIIRDYFFKSEWYDVYDIIEFVANNFLYSDINTKFMEYCNNILERELSAYRFVRGKIIQITSKEEISEIEEALKVSEPLNTVNTRLKRALDLLSDKKSSDYRNSIKESISAMEAICNLITKEKNATLGQALKKIETKVNLHPALKRAFSSLYGYTSDAEGIRHALLNEPNLGFEDAKFMLVSCSTFVNYLISKVSKAGIEI